MVRSKGERILSSWEESSSLQKSKGSWSHGGEDIGGMLSHILSGLPVGAFVPTYTPLQKCTRSRDFHGKSNQENYHQADNVSGKESTTIRISSRGQRR